MIVSRSALDAELSQLRDNILKLGSMVENAIGEAMHALEKLDVVAAQRVIVGDEQVNQLRYLIEENCVRVLAIQQPAASDLREVLAVVHIATELERIGDHASGIARLVERMGTETDINSLHNLPKMANRARKMVRKSLQAYIAQDADLAAGVIERDEKLDRQYGNFSDFILTELNAAKSTDDLSIPTYMLWMGHNLERIGDRVTNIAERVIFMVSGRFVELGD